MGSTADAWAKMDIQEFAGLCVGVIDGKIAITDKDAGRVVQKLKGIKNRNIGIICVPSTKHAMVI